MKVGIFIADSNGGYPVPAVKGGAVSTLVEHLVDENNKNKLIDMEIISLYNREAKEKSKNYPNVKFIWVRPPRIISWMDSIAFYIFRILLKKKKAISYKSIFSLIYYISKAISIVKTNTYEKIVLENNIPLAWIIKKSKYRGDYYYHLHNIPRINAGCKDVFQNATSILCVSNYVAEQVQKKDNPIGPIDPEKTRVLYNCIDTNHFQRVLDENKLKNYREKHGIKEDDKVVIFVGRLSKEKGVDKVLDAVIALDRPDIKLVIVGSLIYNVNIQDEYQQMLHKKAEILGDRVVFTGYISQDELPAYYSMADVAVLPSMWDEPAGLTMIEAMACGLPVITTNSGGIPEYVGSRGMIIEKDENVEKGICKLIESELNEKKDFQKLLDSSGYIKERFSSSKYLMEFLYCLKISN